MKTINVVDLKKNMLIQSEDDILIDVRTHGEYKEESIVGAKNIPLETLEVAALSLKGYKNVFVQCRSGMRSAHACGILEKEGVNAINVEGGIDAWKRAGFEITK